MQDSTQRWAHGDLDEKNGEGKMECKFGCRVLCIKRTAFLYQEVGAVGERGVVETTMEMEITAKDSCD